MAGSIADAGAWFVGRLPDDWFVAAPDVTVDRDEIVVVGELAAPEVAAEGTPEGTPEVAPRKAGDTPGRRAAEEGRIRRFREETRHQRIEIAREAEARYGRAVAWGATCGGTRQVFTALAAPVMTRLRQPERRVLDTLVDAGVARSRSEALAWCVRLVGQHQGEWIGELRDALVAVQRARVAGPAV